MSENIDKYFDSHNHVGRYVISVVMQGTDVRLLSMCIGTVHRNIGGGYPLQNKLTYSATIWCGSLPRAKLGTICMKCSWKRRKSLRVQQGYICLPSLCLLYVELYKRIVYTYRCTMAHHHIRRYAIYTGRIGKISICNWELQKSTLMLVLNSIVISYNTNY